MRRSRVLVSLQVVFRGHRVPPGIRRLFPPGIGHEKHFHNPHFGYVLEGGKLRITSAEGEVIEVQTTTGGSWSSDKITVHEALNIGATTTSYLIVEPRVQ